MPSSFAEIRSRWSEQQRDSRRQEEEAQSEGPRGRQEDYGEAKPEAGIPDQKARDS